MTEVRWIRVPPALLPFKGPVGPHGEVYLHAADVLAAVFEDVDELVLAIGRILERQPG